MLRIQSLLRDRFRQGPDGALQVVSCAIFDAIAPEFLARVLELDFTFKFFSRQSDAAPPSGIRRPTQLALRELAKTLDPASTFVLRVIQDAFVPHPRPL